MKSGVRFEIDKIGENGEPLAPTDVRRKFISQCGVIVRDNIVISIREWSKPAVDDGSVSYVDDRSKNDLYDKLIASFTLPPLLSETEKKKVKHWTLMKMAEQFRNFKKTLWSTYKVKKEAPIFTGTLEKHNYHWPAFKAYKESAEAEAISAKNKINAAKKVYHHKLGPGGYKTAKPKWDRAEAACMLKG